MPRSAFSAHRRRPANPLTEPRSVSTVDLVRFALQALDEVRHRRQRLIHGHRGHREAPQFKLRRVLRVSWERLDTATVAKVFERLHASDTDVEVAAPSEAWLCGKRRFGATPNRGQDMRRRLDVCVVDAFEHVRGGRRHQIAGTVKCFPPVVRQDRSISGQ